MVMGEALRNAGLLDVPSGLEEFRRFTEGPLYLAAVNVIGPDRAKALRTKLQAFTALTGSDASSTLPLPRSKSSHPGLEKRGTLPAMKGGDTERPPPPPRHSEPTRDRGKSKPSDTLPYGDKKKY
jgi:hypothetical protein